MIYLLTLGFHIGDCYNGNPPYLQNVIIKVLDYKEQRFEYCYMPKCEGNGWAQIDHLKMYTKVDCPKEIK